MSSVYLPRRDARKVARTRLRQLNLVGLNRRPEQVLVGGIEGCRLGVRGHS